MQNTKILLVEAQNLLIDGTKRLAFEIFVTIIELFPMLANMGRRLRYVRMKAERKGLEKINNRMGENILLTSSKM